MAIAYLFHDRGALVVMEKDSDPGVIIWSVCSNVSQQATFANMYGPKRS